MGYTHSAHKISIYLTVGKVTKYPEEKLCEGEWEANKIHMCCCLACEDQTFFASPWIEKRERERRENLSRPYQTFDVCKWASIEPCKIRHGMLCWCKVKLQLKIIRNFFGQELKSLTTTKHKLVLLFTIQS